MTSTVCGVNQGCNSARLFVQHEVTNLVSNRSVVSGMEM